MDKESDLEKAARQRHLCPLSNRPCRFCALYRGRHYYMPFCRRPQFKQAVAAPTKDSSERVSAPPSDRSAG